MMKFASEKAMALVDGQLAPADAPALVQELARNPALMTELQKYLAMGRSRIALPYESRRQAPVPQHLIDTLLHAPMGAASRPIGRLASIRSLLGRIRDRYRVPGWSLAAGPALAGAVVAVAAWLLMPTSSMGSFAEADLARALGSTASDSKAALVALRPVLSFRSKSAEFCRQYEVQYGTRQSSHGVACRKTAGNWQVMLATKAGPTGTMPAGAAARKPVDDYVTDAMVAQLDLAQEKDELAKGRKSP